jgi:hypothetical protein
MFHFINVIAGHGMLAYESSHTGKGTCIKCFLKSHSERKEWRLTLLL